MPLRERVKDKVTTFNGQKSGLPIESIGFSDAVAIENFTHFNGALKRINGGETYADVLPENTGQIKWLGRYKKLWMAQRDFGICCETSEDSASFQRVLYLGGDSLTSNNKIYSVPWRDKIYLANGVDGRIFYNQTDTVSSSSYKMKSLGLDPPDSTFGWDASWLGQVNAGNVADGTYGYIITFYDEDTNTESPGVGALSAASGIYELSPNGRLGPRAINITVSGGPKKVSITFANISAALAVAVAANPRISHFIIYRATYDGTLYEDFQQVPLKNGTAQDGQKIIRISTFTTLATDFVDNTATGSLEDVFLPDNNSPWPTPARLKAMRDYAAANLSGSSATPSYSLSDYQGPIHLEVFRDQLFAVGPSSPGIYVNDLAQPDGSHVAGTIYNFNNILYGSEVYQPDYCAYIWEVGAGDGIPTVGVAALSDIALLVYKTNSIYYLAGSSPDNYVLRPMDLRHGAVSQSTIQKTPIGVIALDRSGFVLVDKIGEAKLISEDIKDIVEDINFDNASSFYSWYEYDDRHYMCAVTTGGSRTPNTTLCFDIDSSQWAVINGVRGAASMMDSGSDQEVRILLGSHTTGKLINRADSSIVTFLGSPIRSRWKSGPVTFGDEQRKKRIRWIYIKAKSYTDYTLDIKVTPDYDSSRAHTIEGFNSLSAFSTWYSSDLAEDGNLIWDEGSWSDESVRKFIKIPVSSVGYSFQIEIINKSTDSEERNFIFENISCEAVLMGR